MKIFAVFFIYLITSFGLGQETIFRVTEATQISFKSRSEVSFVSQTSPLGNSVMEMHILEADKLASLGLKVSDAKIDTAKDVLVSFYIDLNSISKLDPALKLRVTLRPRGADNKVIESGASATAFLNLTNLQKGITKTSKNNDITNSITAGNYGTLEGNDWAFVLAVFESLPEDLVSSDILIQASNQSAIGSLYFSGWSVMVR